MPFPGWYAGSLLYPDPPVSSRSYPGTDGFFEIAPIDPPRGRPERNLSENDVWVTKGAEVVTADGHRLGHVHDLLYDDAGAITGVVVRSGLVQHHDRELPAAWIGEIDDDRVRLTKSMAEVTQSAPHDTAS